MANNNLSQQFDFEFDAPKFSEFLPNKDISYYSPQECAINKNNHLDLWFLTYHADHYVCTDKRKQKRKQSTYDLTSQTQAPHSSSDADDQINTRKRKQISSDKYQERIKTENDELIQKRKSTNYTLKRQSQIDKGQLIQDQRRQSKLSLNIKPQKLNAIADISNQNPINLNAQQDKRQSKLFSKTYDQNSTNINKNLIKSDSMSQKEIFIKNKQMIPEENIDLNTEQSTQNLLVSHNIDDILDNQSDETTQTYDQVKVNNIFQATPNYLNNQNTQKIQQQQKSNFNLFDVKFQNKQKMLPTIDTIQNKFQVKDKRKSIEVVQKNAFQAISPKRRNSIDKQNNIFNKIESNMNQNISQNRRQTIDRNILNKQKEQNLVQTMSSEINKTNIVQNNKRASVDNIKINTSQNKMNEVDQINNQQPIRRNRLNRNKSISTLSIDNTVDQQLQKQQRHSSLSTSQTRKSVPNQNIIQKSNKRKSDQSIFLRSQTIFEEQNHSENILQFEKNWEKQNGIKLYMLDYQKRKEIRSQFIFEQSI